jgi:hypothetical protein
MQYQELSDDDLRGVTGGVSRSSSATSDSNRDSYKNNSSEVVNPIRHVSSSVNVLNLKKRFLLLPSYSS